MATTIYATLTELKQWLRIDADDDVDDAMLTVSLNAASRKIDEWAGWQFYVDDATDTRTYGTASDGSEFISDHTLYIPDPISTTTGLVVATDPGADGSYDTTWTINTDFIVEPANQNRAGITGFPYYKIRSVGGKRFFPNREPSVEITATFGWAAVPDAVKQACLIQATKLFKRRTFQEGVIIEAGAAMPMGLDMDVWALLSGYRRPSPYMI